LDGWIQGREVFLTYWAIKALAEMISKDPRLGNNLPIRLRPQIELLGTGKLRLHQLGKDIALPPAVIAVLRTLGTGRSLSEIAAEHDQATLEAFGRALPALLQKGILDRGL